MSPIANIAVVALGGAIGSCLRYGVGQIESITAKGLSTFIVNVVGCFVIGVLYVVFSRWEIAEHWRLLLFVGLLGGFTTYSTYMLDAIMMVQAGDWFKAVCYVLMTNIAGLLSAVAGIYIMTFCVKSVVR